MLDFMRQNMTSIDVIFWRLKWIPALGGSIVDIINIVLDMVVLHALFSYCLAAMDYVLYV